MTTWIGLPRWLLSLPLKVVGRGGDPSGDGQDKFPITNVGNNGDGEGNPSQGQEENQDDNLDWASSLVRRMAE